MHHAMPLATLDLLVGIVAPRGPHLRTEGLVDPGPPTGATLGPEVMVDEAPIREVMGPTASGAPRAPWSGGPPESNGPGVEVLATGGPGVSTAVRPRGDKVCVPWDSSVRYDRDTQGPMRADTTGILPGPPYLFF